MFLKKMFWLYCACCATTSTAMYPPPQEQSAPKKIFSLTNNEKEVFLLGVGFVRGMLASFQNVFVKEMNLDPKEFALYKTHHMTPRLWQALSDDIGDFAVMRMCDIEPLLQQESIVLTQAQRDYLKNACETRFAKKNVLKILAEGGEKGLGQPKNQWEQYVRLSAFGRVGLGFGDLIGSIIGKMAIGIKKSTCSWVRLLCPRGCAGLVFAVSKGACCKETLKEPIKEGCGGLCYDLTCGGCCCCEMCCVPMGAKPMLMSPPEMTTQRLPEKKYSLDFHREA